MPRKSTKKRATTGKRRTQRGKGLRDILSKAHQFVKDNRLISRGLGAFGGTNPYAMAAATAARQLGYGRRKKRTTVARKKATTAKRTRKMHGAGFFSDLGGGFAGLGSGIGSVAHGLFGSGRPAIVPFIGMGRKRRTTRARKR